MPPNSRLISLSVLNEVDQDKKTLDHTLDATFTRIGNLPQRDKNLIFTIVYGVLRHRNRLDWILGHFSRTGLNKLDPEVLNILRIGLFQVVYLTRIPESAAVNTAVDLAKTLKKPWLTKFVNAVLRAAVREYRDLSPPDMENDPGFGNFHRKIHAPVADQPMDSPIRHTPDPFALRYHQYHSAPYPSGQHP